MYDFKFLERFYVKILIVIESENQVFNVRKV